MTHAKKEVDVMSVAAFFIKKAIEEKKPLTNKKLQKLLYYAQAWSLVLQNKPLFDAKIEAWVHGPAVREVYVAFKKFGFGPIIQDASIGEYDELPVEDKNVLEQVWKVYGKYDAAYLEHLTHSEKPWQEAREGVEPHIGSSNEISPESMRDFYSSKLHEINQ